MSGLMVAPCSYEAAKFAVMHWHYSRRMPRSKLATFGAWELGQYIGAVIFGLGASGGLGAQYGLAVGQAIELVRVALREHAAPVSQVVSLTLRELKQRNPGTRLVVSFADPEQNHHGGIYQAGNWVYAGMSAASDEYIVNGRRYQGRALRKTREGYPPEVYANTLEWARAKLDPNAQMIKGSSKHRYLMPLDRAMRRRIERLAKPCPARRAVEASKVTR